MKKQILIMIIGLICLTSIRDKLAAELHDYDRLKAATACRDLPA